MNNKRFAAIDAGTNTILMVIGEVDNIGKLTILRDEHDIARLGENLNSTGFIKITAAIRARKILEKYLAICNELNVNFIDIVGTSALRDAHNSEHVCTYLSKISDVKVRVIPGEEEAGLSFLGSVEDATPSVVIDIGGGSTEMIQGESGHINHRHSMNFGAVRITEMFFANHPPAPEDIKNARKFVRSFLDKLPASIFKGRIYAVAGTPTTIATVAQGLKDFNESKVHGYILTQQVLSNVLNIFLSNQITELIGNYNIHPKRADIITAGALILEEIMKYLNVKDCFVSAKGLRYGVLSEMIDKHK